MVLYGEFNLDYQQYCVSTLDPVELKILRTAHQNHFV